MATRRHFLSLGGAAIAAALGACSTTDPLGTGSANGTGLVVGSQQYYSNEIIAEIYAHALEQAGFAVTRQFQIGQREVYLPELRAGRVDVFPDYSGNLLQSLDASSTATTSAEVEAALAKALPAGLRALRAAPASDQDSYNVTRQSAERYQLVSLADLTRAPQPVRIGGNAELATRPYGPRGLTSHYGIETHLVAVEDSGGPLTRKALAEGTVLVADLYSSDPEIVSSGFVTLTDPKSMILPQNVVPIVSPRVNPAAVAALEKVQARLDTPALRELNAQSKQQQRKASDIARAWLSSIT